MANPDNLLVFSGIMLFSAWLLKTGLGRSALDHAPVRRTRLSPVVIPVAFVIWMIPPSCLIQVAGRWTGQWPDWHRELLNNLIMVAGAGLTVALIMVLAYWGLARGLKGLGLGMARLHMDLVWAAVILFTIWPLMLGLVQVVTWIGQVVEGQGYQIPQHQALETLVHSPQWLVRLSVVVLAVVVAPIQEELLFRGMLQTLVRSFDCSPWWSITISSVPFAMVHANWEHWPALFVLSMGLGYAYEQSGSLWRSIFMHALFNGVTVAWSLLGR